MPLLTTFKKLDECFGQPLTLTNLRAVILLMLRTHYGDSGNFGDQYEALKCLVYDPDAPDASTLGIELGSVLSVKNPGPRPGIYVDFDGKTVWKKKVLNNSAGWSEDNSTQNFAWLVETNIIVSHLSDSIDLSLTMAESSTSLFLGLRTHLMKTLNIASFEVQALSFPKPPEKDIERYYRVDLILAFTFSFHMSVNLESHRLKKFALELSST
jgi:hypothetical protein